MSAESAKFAGIMAGGDTAKATAGGQYVAASPREPAAGSGLRDEGSIAGHPPKKKTVLHCCFLPQECREKAGRLQRGTRAIKRMEELAQDPSSEGWSGSSVSLYILTHHGPNPHGNLMVS